MLGVAEGFLMGKGVSVGYANNVRRTARKMHAAGITPANISGELLNRWLTSMSLSPNTLASERSNALSLWRFGIEVGIISAPIRQVKKIRKVRRVIRAFARGQCTEAVKRFSLIDQKKVFQHSKCPINLWMEAWMRLCYETAARMGDAYSLRVESLVPGGVAFVASKTGQPIVRQTSPRTMLLLHQLAALSPDGTVFSWAVSRRWAFANIRRYFEMAGLHGGRSQWLRRAAATHAEMVEPGAGARLLDHRSGPALTERHYLDQTQLMRRMPSAPLLD
jgi:integrase